MRHLKIPQILLILLIGLGSTSVSALVQHKIKSGDSLYSILKKHRFNEQQVRSILVKTPFSKSHNLIPGEVYHTKKLAASRIELKFFSRLSNKSVTFWRNGQKEAGFDKKIENFQTKVVTVSGKIVGSIIGSILSKIRDKKIAYRFLDAYVLNHNLKRSLKRGARYSITYEKQFLGTQFIKNGEILKTSIDINGEAYHKKLVKFSGGASFVDPNRNQDNKGFYAPVDYLSVSSVFQKRRFHPIKRRRQAHLGVDFALPIGSPVYTTFSGKIMKRGRTRGAGRYVVIRHPNGFESYYNHLSKISDNVVVGKYVSNGFQVGEVGCSGYCTRPHLHFAIKKNNRFVNPLRYMKSFPFIGKKHVDKFLSTAPRLDSNRKTI